MNRFDMEFWNGILKGKIDDLLILEKLKESIGEGEAEIVDICLRAINDSKKKIEKLHARDARTEMNKLLGEFD